MAGLIAGTGGHGIRGKGCFNVRALVLEQRLLGSVAVSQAKCTIARSHMIATHSQNAVRRLS